MKALGWILGIGIAAPFLFGVSVAGCLLEALALVRLNDWFLVPIYHLPPLGYWQAAGIALIFGLISNHADMATEVEGFADCSKRTLRQFLRPLIVLGFGYCFHVWAS